MEAPGDIERLRVTGQGLRVGYCPGRLARGMKLSVIVRYLTFPSNLRGREQLGQTQDVDQRCTNPLETSSMIPSGRYVEVYDLVLQVVDVFQVQFFCQGGVFKTSTFQIDHFWSHLGHHWTTTHPRTIKIGRDRQ